MTDHYSLDSCCFWMRRVHLPLYKNKQKHFKLTFSEELSVSTVMNVFWSYWH